MQTMTAFAKYDRNYEQVTPRTIHHKIQPPKPFECTWKIPKMPGPGPCSYNMTESFDKTARNTRGWAKTTNKRIGFTERNAQLYKSNPGVGKYKNVARGLKTVGKSTFDSLKPLK